MEVAARQPHHESVCVGIGRVAFGNYDLMGFGFGGSVGRRVDVLGWYILEIWRMEVVFMSCTFVRGDFIISQELLEQVVVGGTCFY